MFQHKILSIMKFSTENVIDNRVFYGNIHQYQCYLKKTLSITKFSKGNPIIRSITGLPIKTHSMTVLSVENVIDNISIC